MLNMPELPEVETTRRGLAPYVEGRKVTGVVVRERRLRWPVPDELGQALTGRVIEAIDRRGKYLLLRTEQGRLMMHLGMSGSLRIVPPESQVRKHDHLDLLLEGLPSKDIVLRFHDPRRFGSVHWLAGEESHSLLTGLGPEPLGDQFDGEHLFQKSRGRKVAVKLFIMNAQTVVGVGNIYANEALFLAGIHPERPAGALTRRRYQQLAARIQEVLAGAIEAGGTTLRDFVKEDGSPGYFAQSLAVYGRGGAPCMNCGRRLKEVRLGNRTTVFCTRCQR